MACANAWHALVGRSARIARCTGGTGIARASGCTGVPGVARVTGCTRIAGVTRCTGVASIASVTRCTRVSCAARIPSIPSISGIPGATRYTLWPGGTRLRASAKREHHRGD